MTSPDDGRQRQTVSPDPTQILTPANESASPRAPASAPSSEGGEAGSAAEPGSSDDVPRPDPEIHTALDVEVQNPCGAAEVRSDELAPWAAKLAATLLAETGAWKGRRAHGPAPSLTLRFVDDEEMAELNATYRRKDGPTDVLTFPGDVPAVEAARSSWRRTPAGFEPGAESFPGEALHLGDVVISVPTARRQAATRGHGVEREIRVLVLHGVLHALGFDHEVDDGTMERTERELRRRLVDGSPTGGGTDVP